MSRLSKIFAVTIVVVFLLACSLVTQPAQDAQQLAKTAQAIGSAIPAGTLEALGTNMPDVENIFNPQGAPVQEWKGIPVMPQATAGQEFAEGKTYSYRATAAMQDVQNFYNQKLPALGWSEPFDIPSEGDAALMVFQKENSTLTITITASEDSCVVLLAME